MNHLKLSCHDARPQIKPSIGDIISFSIKPRWWVRAMSATADALWNCHLTTASWAIADLCIWLQKKTKPIVTGGKAA